MTERDPFAACRSTPPGPPLAPSMKAVPIFSAAPAAPKNFSSTLTNISRHAPHPSGISCGCQRGAIASSNARVGAYFDARGSKGRCNRARLDRALLPASGKLRARWIHLPDASRSRLRGTR